MKRINTAGYAFLVYAIVILALIIFSGRASHVFIEHDDWIFMSNPPSWYGTYGSPWAKTLSEGRWINFLYSFVQKELDFRVIYYIQVSLYAILCWLFSYKTIANNIVRLAFSISLFLCMPIIEIMGWPATQTPFILITIAFIYSFEVKNIYLRTFSGYILGIMAILTYPVALAIMCIYMSIKASCEVKYNTSKTIKWLLFIGLFYFLSYLSGVVIIYALNSKFHGVFGVVIEAWRNPKPAHDYATLMNNISSTSLYFLDIFDYYGIILVLFIISVVVAFASSFRSALVVMCPIVLSMTIDILIHVYSGVDVPARSTAWLWFGFASILILLLNSNTSSIIKLLVSASLASLIYMGMSYWFDIYKPRYATEVTEDILYNKISTYGDTSFYLCTKSMSIDGMPKRGVHAFMLSMYKKHNITTRILPWDVCVKQANYGDGFIRKDSLGRPYIFLTNP
ncbi:hypothetical protein ACUADT_001042 [Enterobacter cloacae]